MSSIITTSACPERKFLRGDRFERNGEDDLGALPRRRPDIAAPADFLQPSCHVFQPVSRCESGRAICNRLSFCPGSKPTTVVLDHQFKGGGPGGQSDVRLRCSRMFGHVVQCLFEGEKQIMTEIRCQPP